MKDGSRAVAEGILAKALSDVRRRMSKKDPNDVLKEAVRNASPLIEFRTRRVAGALYRVPIPLPPSRQARLGLLAILDRARGAGPLWRNLAAAIVAGYRGEISRPDVAKDVDPPPRRA
jgi:small subunit ribosomal protein S7